MNEKKSIQSKGKATASNPATYKHLIRDSIGRVTHIEHIHEPFLSASLSQPTPEQLADEYVATVAPIYGLNAGMIADFAAPVAGRPAAIQSKLHRGKTKDLAGSIVVDYSQTYNGLPVWRADLAVHIASNPMRVTSSTSAVHGEIKLGNDPKAVAKQYKKKLTNDAIFNSLGRGPGTGISKINEMRLVIYEYDPAQRIELGSDKPEPKGVSFETRPPMPKLPPVPKTFKTGMHYAVVEVFFDLALPKWKDLHWQALIEPITGTVLYLRALIAFATGSIFQMDPISRSGNATLTPATAQTSLDNWRSSEPLTDLILTPGMQDLSGVRVDQQEIESPSLSGPVTTSPFDFTYHSKTANFAAVNAYYHINWLFNLIQGMGFNLSSYFDGTTFPVPVDPWSLNLDVNAHCPGNTSGNGIGHFCFGAAEPGQNVGIAADVRVVIHEFGHALLWDHVNFPNFGFAHSAGDSLGAILMDPNSIAPDRFLTFPWPRSGGVPLDRRHDRQVTNGWGWFGNQYDSGYRGEQVLSTTLFRLYQSVGGDSPNPADRLWASRYVSYLIIKAIGMLTTTTTNPEVFVTNLMNADLTTTNFEGHPGGALHKVIRWAFEKQGLFQPNAHFGTAIPVTQVGNPPLVDVYIDDGRHGEYQYLYAFWESQDMWVRRVPDNGTIHENPIIGRPNYMYVRVKNRGTQQANNVVVKAYHCNPGTGLAWPDHWSPMDTPLLAAPNPIPSGGEVVVGPFAWTPEVFGHECLLAIASATDDLGNDTTVMSPIPCGRFVPFDNNIGQRNVCPVYEHNWKEILKLLQKLTFYVINPFHETVNVVLVPVLPKYLSDQKYWVFFTNPGGNKFQLAPHESKKIYFNITQEPQIPSRYPWIPVPPTKPGIPTLEKILADNASTSFREILRRGRPIKFHIVTLIEGQNMGGMTYIMKQE